MPKSRRDTPDADSSSASCTEAQLQQLEQTIATTLESAANDPEISTEPSFTLILRTR